LSLDSEERYAGRFRAKLSYADKSPLQAETSAELALIVGSHLKKYAGSRSPLSREKCDKPKPGSIGIHLGPFKSEATGIEAEPWAKHDVIILDPFQDNAVTTVTSLSERFLRYRQIIGRIDLKTLLNPPPSGRNMEPYCISSLDQILSIILTRFKSLNGSNNGFTGILFAGWDVFPAPVLLELNYVISTLDLNVYLETSAPDFLHDPKILASDAITGLVIRNGLLFPNGQRRDCFDMEKFRPTVSAFVSQACVRDFTVFMWETLDEDVMPSNAILQRTYKWCNFYNTTAWVGSKNALYDESVEVVEHEPFSAFNWLKEPRVVELHEIWRNERTVSLTILEIAHSQSPTSFRTKACLAASSKSNTIYK
jgi:hypothetical protein